MDYYGRANSHSNEGLDDEEGRRTNKNQQDNIADPHCGSGWNHVVESIQEILNQVLGRDHGVGVREQVENILQMRVDDLEGVLKALSEDHQQFLQDIRYLIEGGYDVLQAVEDGLGHCRPCEKKALSSWNAMQHVGSKVHVYNLNKIRSKMNMRLLMLEDLKVKSSPGAAFRLILRHLYDQAPRQVEVSHIMKTCRTP
jgi:hypothetical protein